MSIIFTEDNFRNIILSFLNLDYQKENNLRKLIILSIRREDPANNKKDNNVLLREIDKYDCHQTSLIAKRKIKLIANIENHLGTKLSDEDAVNAKTVNDLYNAFLNNMPERNNENTNTVRTEFPFFNNQTVVYLDSAATTQKPYPVIKTVTDFYTNSCANANRSSYNLAQKATYIFERCRSDIAAYLNTNSSCISFTKGTTESINIVARSLEEYPNIGSKNIVISEMEHSSNRLPWENLSRKTGCELRVVPITSGGTLEADEFKKISDRNTVAISVTGMSNINGFSPDIKKISSVAKENNSYFIIDASQLIAHSKINIEQTDCDFLCFSGHKIYAPEGTGVLYHSERGMEILKPLLYGGGMLNYGSERYMEAGTQNIAGLIGLAKALEYLKEEYFIKEQELADYVKKKLGSLPGLKFFASEHSPVISFVSDYIPTDVIAQHLFDYSIAVRTGSCCSPWMLKKLGTESVCRISLGIYTNESDIETLIKSMEILHIKTHNAS